MPGAPTAGAGSIAAMPLALFAIVALGGCGGGGEDGDAGDTADAADDLDAADSPDPGIDPGHDTAADPPSDSTVDPPADTPADDAAEDTRPELGPCGGYCMGETRECPAGALCEFGILDITLACTDDGCGMCAWIPEECPPDDDPACGCDGVVYQNPCERRRAHAQPDIAWSHCTVPDV